MKKLTLLAMIMIATCVVALAQPRAIGGRLGWGIGPSYQHALGEKNMLQADIDLIGYGWWGVQGTVTYNWIIPLKEWSAVNWNLYAGVGAGGGYEWWGGGYGWYGHGRLNRHYGTGAFVGVAGMVGLEWNFKFPLQLSIDYRPLAGVKFYTRGYYYIDKNGKDQKIDFYDHGLYASAIAIGVKYKFGGK